MKHLKQIFILLDKWRYHYLLAALLLMLSVFVRSIEPKILQLAIDGVINWHNSAGKTTFVPTDFVSKTLYSLLPTATMQNVQQLLFLLVTMFMTIALLRGLSMFASSIISAHCTEHASKSLRDRLFLHLQRLPLSFFGTLSTGEIIQRCTGDIETVKKFIAKQLIDCLMLGSLLLFSFGMIYIVYPPLAFVAVLLTPVIIYTSYKFGKREGAIWEEHEAEQDKLTSIVEENLSGVRVVKAFAKEDFEIAKFDQQNTAKRAIGFRHIMLHANFWPFSDWLVHLQMTIAVFVGGYFTLLGKITIGELAAFYSYAAAVSFPMQRLGRIVSEMGMAIVAMERIASILDVPEEDYSGKTPTKHINGSIEFRNVSFKYRADDADWVLDNVSFKINAGDKVAFLGPTGAGKSTIISLLLRFYEPTEGEIYLDEKPLNTYHKTYLRQRIGVVLQKPFLFSTTIAQNIAYTKPNIDHHEIVTVAKAASIHEIMDIFPEGYNTMVGEKGVTLSGGQKQRVALARTLLEQPDLLILDDTTSAVDTETEYAIQRELKNYLNNKTSIIVANRIVSVMDCDQILVLDKGKVVQHGTHNALLNQAGFYRKVYDIQISNLADV